MFSVNIFKHFVCRCAVNAMPSAMPSVVKELECFLNTLSTSSFFNTRKVCINCVLAFLKVAILIEMV